MENTDCILIAGGHGQLGSAIIRNLLSRGYVNIVAPNSKELDLCDQQKVREYFEKYKPNYVFFCAAVIGGIEYKQEHPADIFVNNMKMMLNIFENARKYGCKRVLFVATALVYPYDAEIPTSEKDIRQICPEGPDSPYTLVKYSGIKMCEYYRSQYGCEFYSVIPCNFFGPNGPFDGSKAGVVQSLIRRMHEAKINGSKEVIVWGSGNAGRDFLGVDDVADACVYTINAYAGITPLNIGSGKEISIHKAAEEIRSVVEFEGNLIFDKNKPEGRKHMLLDTTAILSCGWKPKHSFKESVAIAYEWYRSTL